MTNLQDIFDRTVNHLRAQGPSIDPRGSCRYRWEANGKVLKCAVGLHIPDEEYDEGFEGDSLVNTKDAKGRRLKDLLDPEALPLLMRLQECHDDNVKLGGTWHPDFEPDLKRCAEEFGLRYTAP